MKTEREKMLAGELYDAFDFELVELRRRARELCHKLNTSPPSLLEEHYHSITSALFGSESEITIVPPFHCDYGENIHFGANVFINFNCTILDEAPVSIGDRAKFGPGVQLLTAQHPLEKAERATGIESSAPIKIGNDVWLGGAVIVCPGVSIGEGSVVGAGSVVTKDIPPNSLAVGNPCRVKRCLA